MPIQFRCQYCRQRLGIADSRAGSLVDCPACGRSLRVPSAGGQVASAPEAPTAPDSELQSALQQLTTFGNNTSAVQTSSHTPQQPRSHVAAKTTLAASPPKRRNPTPTSPAANQPLATSDPLAELAALPSADGDELPLLAQPELLDDTSAADDDNSESNLITPRESASNPATAPQTPAAQSETVQLALALNELATQQPVSQDDAALRPRSLRRVFPVLIPVVTALLAFLAGLLVARSSSGPHPASQPSPTAGADSDIVPRSPQAPELPAEPPAAGQVSGTILVKFPDGKTEPDSGALVIIAPAKNITDLRLDGRFLRDDKTTVAHKALAAALREFQVSFAFAGADGSYTLPLPRQGNCTLIAVSKRIARPTSMPLAEDAASSLAEWFTAPSPITGRLQTIAQSITVPAAGTGIRQDITIVAPAP